MNADLTTKTTTARYAGKHVVITGGSTGLGLAAAQLLTGEGGARPDHRAQSGCPGRRP